MPRYLRKSFTPCLLLWIIALVPSTQSLGQERQSGAAYVNIAIPPAISLSQFSHLSDILILSGAQKLQFEKLYEIYLTEDKQHRARFEQPLWERSRPIAEGQFQEQTRELANDLTALIHDRNDLVRTIESRENRFINSMAPYLSESQIQELPRAINARSRQRSLVLRGKFPGSNVDISERLHLLQKEGFDVVPSDPVLFATELRKYEDAATEVLQKALNSRLNNMVEGTKLYAELTHVMTAERDELERDARRAELAELAEAKGQRIYKANRAVHDLNAQYVQTLSAYLPLETASELDRWFKETTYRVVYPDPYDLSDLISQIREMALTTDVFAYFDVQIQEYTRVSSELSRKMVEQYLQWWEHVEVRSGYEHAVYDEYQASMQKLQLQRAQLAKRSIDSILSILEEGQIKELDLALTKYKSKADQFEIERAEILDQQRNWPLPYDVS